jgi:hypothetical protein
VSRELSRNFKMESLQWKKDTQETKHIFNVETKEEQREMKIGCSGFWNWNCFQIMILMRLNWNEATRWFVDSVGFYTS